MNQYLVSTEASCTGGADASSQLVQQLLDALTTARWDDGSLIVDIDQDVLRSRVLSALLLSLTRLDQLPCLYRHQQLGRWEPAGDDAELVCRRCSTCGTEEIAAVAALAPARSCRPARRLA